MTFDRRSLLKGSTAAALVGVSTGALAQKLAPPPAVAASQAGFAPTPGAWRRFEVTTRLEPATTGGPTQAWVPLPSLAASEWFAPAGDAWTSNGRVEETRDPKYGARMLHVVWDASERAPMVEVVSMVAARDRAAQFAGGTAPALSAQERRLYLDGTDLIPVDGIVKETADRIAGGAQGDLAKARAIYEWVVVNTFRDAATRGCGLGDVAAMLRTNTLSGKCADLNALFVGLARAAGVPARDVYGVRVGPSKFGYRSLGANSETVTKAQHCRAEVFLEGYGWVAVDPADVRKVALEEPPAGMALSDPKVAAARAALFGAWEGNWLPYNVAHDVALPGSEGPRLGFLMYPQAEVAGARLDCLDPDRMRYAIRAREIAAG